MKRMAALLAGAALTLMATGAMAVSINDNRPFTVSAPSSGEDSLQKVLNDNLSGTINAVSGQSNVGVWQAVDGSPTAYAVAFMKGDAGNFGVYSQSTGAEVVLMSNPSLMGTTTFHIDASGNLRDSSFATLASNFGSAFGFFWRDTTFPGVSYTEDSRNAAGTGWGAGQDIRALSYLVADGTVLSGTLSSYFAPPGAVATGDDDWILAFEDRGAGLGGDGDFQDAVFYVKDIAPVPEPGTMMLLGAGFLGLAICGKRRKNA